MQDPVIRRATVQDAAVLTEIGIRTFCETFAHLYPEADLQTFLADAYDVAKTERYLADPARAGWLVEVDGEVIGYAQAGTCDLPHAEVTAACGELKRFYLVQGRQGGGVGGRLFAEVMAWLEKDGARDIWIGVWSENHGAQRFYNRHGFDKVGEYGFQVGSVVDHEFILRRRPERISAQ